MIVSPQITPFSIHKYVPKFNSHAWVAMMMMKNLLRCLFMTQKNEAKTTTNKRPTNQTIRLLQSSLLLLFYSFFFSFSFPFSFKFHRPFLMIRGPNLNLFQFCSTLFRNLCCGFTDPVQLTDDRD